MTHELQKFLKQTQNLSEKVENIYQKRIQDSFINRDLSANLIDGLTQKIKIDLRTTRRHQTIQRFA